MTEFQRIEPRSPRGRSRRNAPTQRYAAFLSYAHEDAETAEWLHESLEKFRVPPALVGRLTEMGAVPKRLTPVFRDRHELAAGDDLKEEIENALAGSRFLIVLCSPDAATSHWTNQEVDAFKRLHGEERVLAVIVSGEPFATGDQQECFPPALKVRYDRRGRPTTQVAEPIAADLRFGGDGRRLALLKVVAGMLGVGLDDLAQRESHRRQRRLAWLTAASIGGMIVTSGLAATAIRARDAAREERRQAEGLIGFMLGDLRKKLEPIGRLDVLDAVGARALAYYERQDKSRLSDASLGQRSKALTLMGEMAQARGDLDGALARYREAKASTEEALRRNPGDPQRLFDQAQNVYWVGYIDYQRGHLDRAIAAMRDYRALAARMVAMAPKKPEYRLEQVYADTNLGTMLMEQRRYSEAADVYQAALDPGEQMVARFPGKVDYQDSLVETLAWLADARERSGQLDEAMALRERELGMLTPLLAANPGDMDLLRSQLTALRARARLLADRRQMPQATAQAAAAEAIGLQLTRREPNNTEWQQAILSAAQDQSDLALASGDLATAGRAADRVCTISASLVARDPSVVTWRVNNRAECLRLRGSLALRSGHAAEAASLAAQRLMIARQAATPIEGRLLLATAQLDLGEALRASGDQLGSRSAYQRALETWPRGIEERPTELARHAILLRRAGQTAEAQTLAKRLTAMGYRRPDYEAAWKQGG